MKTEKEIKDQLAILKKVRRNMYKDICSSDVNTETIDNLKRMINLIDCGIETLTWVLKPDNLA